MILTPTPTPTPIPATRSRPPSRLLLTAALLALAGCQSPPPMTSPEPASPPSPVAEVEARDPGAHHTKAAAEAEARAAAAAAVDAASSNRAAMAMTGLPAPQPEMLIASPRSDHAVPAAAVAFEPPVSAVEDRERYAAIDANPVVVAAESPVSTFSVDVDTGAYANVRRLLNAGRLPPQDAVRTEELINYFDYGYARPASAAMPFTVRTELGVAPWHPQRELLAIGLQGWTPPDAAIRPSNLVFLIDVSGSMHSADKLPLVKASLKLLVGALRAQDRVSLVVYSGRTEVVLEPTPGNERATILAALDRLEAGGSTNGAGGLELAYAMAERGHITGGNNRVLLATDGDFNVGVRDVGRLKAIVAEHRRSGIALSTLGFGTGNLNDALMEAIADVGNGHYRYIDSAREAQRALIDERAAALETIARDVKVQIEFNPAVVAEYRLIGYENRRLAREDFNDDRVDAGDLGAGHRVTALYEITRVGSSGRQTDPLRYGKRAASLPDDARELAWLKLRWKRPDDGETATSRLIAQAVPAAAATPLAVTTPGFRLAAAVAAYGELLRGGARLGDYRFEDAGRLAAEARIDGDGGRAAEFVELARLAAALRGEQARAEPID